MRETGENTTVIDAFDDDDPFDLNLSLGLRQTWQSSNIRRESQLFQPGLSTGNYIPSNENVAKYTQSRTVMEIGADVGLYKDLALSFRLPFILSDVRELGDLDGSSANQQRFQDPTGDQLFNVPFKSPTRSGVDWFSLGLAYAIYNQQRDASKPTWVIGVDGQFVDLSPVKTAEGGSKSITATLSGIPDDAVDADVLAILDDPTKWRSRDADVWQVIRDSDNAQQGGYRTWCAGRIVALNHGGDERGLRITVQIEGYLAALSEASNRTYLDQERYDENDLSAAAAIAIANGNFKNSVVTTTYDNGTDPWSGGRPPIGGLF
ncbi:MAG: hypothetical protein KDJ41_00710 [Hyphomicrobiaceae bacterium]|nr:hypothetical protein [Hyphomicrobiaceae bacterium]